MGTGYTQNVELTITMTIQIRGDYSEENPPSSGTIVSYIEALLRSKLDRSHAKLLTIQTQTKEL